MKYLIDLIRLTKCSTQIDCRIQQSVRTSLHSTAQIGLRAKPASRLIKSTALPLNLQEEEILREGVRVRRIPTFTRSADGHYLRWIARRINVGRGEGSSGLAFDDANA